MERFISSEDAPGSFDDVLKQVSDDGDRYVVEKDGVPLAAVVPIAVYAQWKRRREAFFQRIQETADRAGLNEDEASRVVEEAMDDLRSQM
jgi:prevent-host-death family protein